MTHQVSAGLLMCRKSNGVLQYFLIHPGGPFFKNKDAGVWSIPKGIPEGTEDLIHTAQREFFEETGIKPVPPLYDIGFIKQKSGKVVYAWTFLGAWDPDAGISCNNFSLEWPPRSGRQVEFPEVDKAQWMSYSEAAAQILAGQIPFLDRAKKIHIK